MPEVSRTGTRGVVQNPLDMLRERYSTGSAATGSVALEGAVDPDEYLVGPGDLFTVLIRGLETMSTPIPVSADGRLPLPDVGSVKVADLTLSEARDRIVAALQPSFGEATIDVTLTQPRSFFVHVTGAVGTPGRYQAPPAARVSSVLELAYADTTRLALTNLAMRPSLRNITVVHRDGTETAVDLPLYFSGGDTAHNPYLRDGDVVVVGAYDPAYEFVRIDGSVPFPGTYDFRPDDTVRDLLAVAGVRKAPSFDAVVRLTRIGPDGAAQTRTMSLTEALRDGDGIPIGPRDHLSVEPESLPGGLAAIEGWVFYPGAYPIQEGETTITELLERAGGLREGALTDGAYIVRAIPEPDFRSAPLVDNRFDRVPGMAALLEPDTLAFMQRLRLSEMSFLSRVHFALEYRYQNRVAVDVGAMLRGESDPIALMDGDTVVIPRDRESVYVFGQVVRPGFVHFGSGLTARHYIEAAGGRAPNAGDVVVLRNQNGEILDGPNATVRSGDLVFVDREDNVPSTLQEFQAASLAEEARRDSRFRVIQAVLTGMSTLGTLIALIVSLRRN